ncbi:hypothetical protein M433DRAFT_250653 [Acidomyces richmondensis BFW]|nr:MAG: hypothetical protein FE78DRAFT_396636 [Acidomyces sp. 'richmondensis']KYG45521.1 hypothetical protein M433DRAFT_250653 [Acidomyces richmondensis BFW]
MIERLGHCINKMSQELSFSFRQGGSLSACPQQTQPNGKVASRGSESQPTSPNSGQNTAYLQSAHLPAEDLSALQGVSPEQIALIARLLQSGALSMPSFSTGPELVATTTSVSAEPSVSSARFASASTSHQDINLEKEEGELEEGEEAEQPRAFPEGQHKRRVSSGNQYGDAEERVSFGTQRERAQFTKVRKLSDSASSQGFIRASTTREVSKQASTVPGTFDKSAAAQKFVLAVHKAGYTFEQLAKEVSNVAALRRLYHSLGISTAAGIEHPAPNAPESSQLESQIVPLRVEPTMTDPRKGSATKKQFPPKSEPPNRAEYVARLAALKAKSASKAAEKQVGHLALQPAISEQSVSTQPAFPPATQQSDAKSIQSKSKVTTDLVKQRLALHKAKEAAKKNAALVSSGPSFSSSPVTNPSNLQLHGGLAFGLERDTGKASESSDQSAVLNRPVVPPLSKCGTTAAPAQLPSTTSSLNLPLLSPSWNVVGQPFAGLPGLFMAPSPSTMEQVKFAPSKTDPGPSSSVASAPPANSMPNNDMTAKSESTTPPAFCSYTSRKPENSISIATRSALKRPFFGQSRSSSESEKLVIEVSDEEDDEAQQIGGVSFDAIQQKTGLNQNLPHLPNISTVETSGVSTPGSLAELEEKQKAINAMNRKIAELRARKSNAKVNGKVRTTIKQGESPASGKSTLIVPPLERKSTSPSSADASESMVSKNASSFEAGKSAKALARDQEKAFLQQRLKELQQDMFRHSSPANAAEPLMSGNLSAVDGVHESTALHIDEKPLQSNSTSESQADAAAVADGEVGDDSDEQGVAIDECKIGLQATTVNTSQPENRIAGSATGGIGSQGIGDSGSEKEDDNAVPTSESMQRAIQTMSTGVLVAEDENVDSLGQLHSDHKKLSGSISGKYDDRNNDEGEVQDNISEDDNSDYLGPVFVENRAANTSNDEEKDDIGKESLSNSEVLSNLDADNEGEDRENGDCDPERVPPPITVDITNGNAIASRASSISRVDTDSLDLMSGLGASDAKQVRDEGKPKTYFTPYRSPLAHFKDFRYHPNYLSEVPGGFKSWTYSHQIDPDTPLCQYEILDGKCNDNDCEAQHFASMGLSGAYCGTSP